jgi:hypothetical protein
MLGKIFPIVNACMGGHPPLGVGLNLRVLLMSDVEDLLLNVTSTQCLVLGLVEESFLQRIP